MLGVLANGISPGRDMVMMELDSDAITKAGGIWQGMSGSPVYAEDGRLIGAVAYGLAWGSTPIAGITPFEYMDDYLGPAAEAGRIEVGRRAAEKIAATGEVTRSQAARGFRRLPVPMTMSGVDANRADGVRATRYQTDAVASTGAAGAAGAADVAGIDTVVAGGNLAAVQSVGDINYAGIGTATSVCDGRVVGFGHPMDFVGEVSYGLGAADAIYIQEDPLGVPFKVANLGEVGGTITDDRLTGIAGDLGEPPASATVSSDLTFEGASRVGSTEVYEPLALGSVAFYEHFTNHDAVMDQISTGSELQTFTIEGTDAKGVPFSVSHTDRVRSSWDIAEEASYPLADTLSGLSGVEGVTIESATITGEVTDDESAYRVRKVEQRVGRKWVTLAKKPAAVKAGSTLTLRVTIASAGDTRSVVLSEKIGKKLAGAKGTLTVAGGDGYLNTWRIDSLADLKQVLAKDLRNDSVALRGTVKVRKGPKLTLSDVSGLQDKVVVGRKSVRVVVR
ncbi:SpoIVB peptidase S55 domain-containing protein [Nocardioides sambongensis]|uniref:SpoIVB peptidase S55 domain-containing protein n=1 Tax=Nocardioides sambongensis TaxID=2589074 RepID=UPI0015E864EF|nr:SpoIVB peptidase S55 domain-containing protein [Nocardioides sambongensis]